MLSSVAGTDVKSAGQSQGDGGHAGPGDVRRHQRGRAEHRRHTIANGVDFGMVREQPYHGLLPQVRILQRSLTADTSTVGYCSLLPTLHTGAVGSLDVRKILVFLSVTKLC